MGKVLSIVIGVILLVLGVWLIWLWWEWVKAFLLAGIAISAVVIGLGALAFGISELRSGVEEPPLTTPTVPVEGTSDQPAPAEETPQQGA